MINNVGLLDKLRSYKRNTFNASKMLTEFLWGGGVWLDRSAKKSDILCAIEKLRSHEISCPLIRIGGEGDGGYVLPDDFEGISGCISPGVSSEVGFDFDCAEMGMKVVMADASVDGPPRTHEMFDFHKKFLGTRNDETFIRLDDLVGKSDIDGDLILQMDIEGAEYSVLLDCSEETLNRFRIIVLEIHDFTHTFGKFGAKIINSFVDKLTRSHAVVHIHPNNCCGSVKRYGVEIPRVMELTLYRRDRGIGDVALNRSYPHALDSDNVSNRPPLSLPQVWR